MKKSICGAAVLCLLAASADAALLSRAGGQAYYDTTTNLTWVADANLTRTSGYDADGLLNWAQAQTWIASLNTAQYLGQSDWRLPTVTDTGTSGCTFGFTGTDCGWNVALATGEMAATFYGTLGNIGNYDTGGVATGCSQWVHTYCLTNHGPFSGLNISRYWTGTTDATNPAKAWFFQFNDGQQSTWGKSTEAFAWAVRSGDFVGQAVVPLPAAAWLFGGALAGLGALKRRQAAA